MALEKRKTEQEQIPKEERLKQIQRMRERINQHTSNRTRDVKTHNISNRTQDLIREKLAELPARHQEPDKEQSMER